MGKALLIHVPYEVRGGEDVHVEALSRAYRALGLEPVLAPASRKPPGNALASIGASLALSSLPPELELPLRSGVIDVVHLHNLFPIYGARVLRGLRGSSAPVIMTVHNHRFYCANGLALRGGKACKLCFDDRVAWRPIAYNCNRDRTKSLYHALSLTEIRTGSLLDVVTAFIAPSPYIRDELVRFGVEPSRIHLVLHPIAAGPGWDGAVSEGPFDYDVLYAGRLSAEKGIRELIAAAKLLPGLRFAVAGSGPEEAAVQAARQRLPRFTYLGGRSHSDVPGLLDRTRVAVMPSVCNESLGAFALEAFCRGRRCVVPATESTRWMAEGAWPGIPSDPARPADLAKAIQRALAEPLIPDSEARLLRGRLGMDRFRQELGKVLGDVSAQHERLSGGAAHRRPTPVREGLNRAD